MADIREEPQVRAITMLFNSESRVSETHSILRKQY